LDIFAPIPTLKRPIFVIICNKRKPNIGIKGLLTFFQKPLDFVFKTSNSHIYVTLSLSDVSIKVEPEVPDGMS
jgi:hypothetical protein